MRVVAACVVLYLGSLLGATAVQGQINRATQVVRVRAPYVIGLKLSAAEKLIAGRRLRSRAVNIAGRSPSPDDIVVRQAPDSTQPIPTTSTVTLYVRTPDIPPPQVARTPAVVGRSEADALRIIRIAELRPRFTTEPTRDTALGSVIRQDPVADAPIRADRSIDIVIAGVPKVVGLTRAQAEDAISRAHLRVGQTKDQESADQKDGTVVDQLPLAGQPARPLTTVNLTIARTRTFGMPTLVGQPMDAARRLLADSGLAIRDVSMAKAEGQPDTVVNQSPEAGSTVRRGDGVALVVGRPITLILVPNFVGHRVDSVSSLIDPGSLKIETRYEPPALGARDSIVASQSVDPNTRVPVGSPIVLTVSQREAARLQGLTIEPGNASLHPGDTIRLRAIGRMTDGTQSAVAATWVASAGSIAPDGLYSAGPEMGRVNVVAGVGTLTATAVISVIGTPASPIPWWLIAVIAVGIAGVGWGIWRYFHRPPPPPPPPPVVPPLAFTYTAEMPEVEATLSAPQGHGPELSLESHADEGEQTLQVTGHKLFDEENVNG